MEGDRAECGQMKAVQTICVQGSLLPLGGAQGCGNEAGEQVGAQKWPELEERFIRWEGGLWD